MPSESEKPGTEAASPAGPPPRVPARGRVRTGPVVDADGGDGRRRGGPWTIAWRRLRRNKFALFSLGVFLLILICCLLAPVWANDVAHTGPNTTHTLEKLHEGSEVKEVVEPSGKAIGPQWFAAGGKFFLGADGHLGRDEMVRLLYGGRSSLFIGIVAAVITTVLAVIFGLLAGYYGGWTDTMISRVMDVIWAFPVVLLGDLARHRLGGRRAGDRPDPPEVELPLDPDLDHRLRLHAVYGETPARRSARAA